MNSEKIVDSLSAYVNPILLDQMLYSHLSYSLAHFSEPLGSIAAHHLYFYTQANPCPLLTAPWIQWNKLLAKDAPTYIYKWSIYIKWLSFRMPINLRQPQQQKMNDFVSLKVDKWQVIFDYFHIVIRVLPWTEIKLKSMWLNPISDYINQSRLRSLTWNNKHRSETTNSINKQARCSNIPRKHYVTQTQSYASLDREIQVKHSKGWYTVDVTKGSKKHSKENSTID
jgi:hypothetical protein